MPPYFARISGNLRKSLLVLGGAAVIATLPITPMAGAATPSCEAFSTYALERVKPSNQASSLTLSKSQSDRDAAAGFTSLRYQTIKVATKAGTGIKAVHRLYRSSYGGNFFYALDEIEIARVKKLGYVDQGVVFYAATSSASCLMPMYGFYKGGVHRFATTASDQAMLAKAGWTRGPIRFYVGKPSGDPTFSFAVYPDTQEEVYPSHNGRFRQRSQWLADHRSTYDLRFATHTGDVVNWDTPDHAQYQIARDAFVPLEQAGIPYSLSPGNHDTAAVCPGGSACDPARTNSLLRDTSTFQRYFNHPSAHREGAYPSGSLDNTYSVYSAGGVSWMVLNLELWPRLEVVRWAQRVVADHPRHNVIVVTHSYLTSTGAISTSAGGYGDTAPSVLARELILKYPNIRLVFSGHTGVAAHRVDKGVYGNRVVSMLNTFHSRTTNPVRMVEIDTRSNRLKSWVYAPWTSTTFAEHSVTFEDLDWVR